jgi:phospholipase/carboxylesterase
MHGLGADASDMMSLADQLTVTDVAFRHVFINAPMRPVTLNAGMVMPAWYDIKGVKLTDREDEEGIKRSEQLILKIIEEQLNAGFTYSQIVLAGFSQGGAMAMYTALHITERIGGVVALSAYLPLAAQVQSHLNKSTPFFMGLGLFDTLVLPQWTDLSKDVLTRHGYEHIAYHRYPMEHSICFEEIKDLSLWLRHHVGGIA